MQIDAIRHYFTGNLATYRWGGIQGMSPLPKESLKLINFLQHETSQACTHLRLAEILCRQTYIPNEKCTYNIFIFESSVVETQFWGSLPVLKFLFHGPAYHSLFLQWGRGTTAATNLVPLQWENYRPLFTRNGVSENLKWLHDLPRD